jgi:hypothetical protein
MASSVSAISIVTSDEYSLRFDAFHSLIARRGCCPDVVQATQEFDAVPALQS